LQGWVTTPYSFKYFSKLKNLKKFKYKKLKRIQINKIERLFIKQPALFSFSLVILAKTKSIPKH
jgi:hypothetical protein